MIEAFGQNQTEICKQVMQNEITKAVNEATASSIMRIRVIIIFLFLWNIGYMLVSGYLKRKNPDNLEILLKVEKVYFACNLTISAFLLFLRVLA